MTYAWMTVNPLARAVFQVLIHFLVIGPLKEQPAGVGKVEERLAILIHEVVPVGADLESQVLDRGCASLVASIPGRGRLAAGQGDENRRRPGGEYS